MCLWGERFVHPVDEDDDLTEQIVMSGRKRHFSLLRNGTLTLFNNLNHRYFSDIHLNLLGFLNV